MAPKRHKSYTAGFKLSVISQAEKIGNRAASRVFEVDERCICRWRQEKEELKNMPQQKRAKRSGTVRWPDLEKNLVKWITDRRKQSLPVSTTKVRFQAKLMARDMNLENFKGGPCWCYRFMKRNKISVRAKTTVGQQLPVNWEDAKSAFVKYVKDIVEEKKFLSSQIVNMDEVPLTFDCPANRTLDRTGTKTVSIRTTGHERTSFTCVLACAANGDKLKPLIIFKRKTLPKGDFPKDVVISANENGWMCEAVMHEWLQKILRSRRGFFFQPKGLLIMDSMRSHLLDSVKTACKKLSTDIAIIPGGLTKILQPLDLAVNKSFKAEVRKEWECWMTDGLHNYTKSGKMRRASYEEVSKWVSNAWKSVKVSCIISGFREAGMAAISEPESQEDENDDPPEVDCNLDEDFLDLFKSDSEESDFDGFGDADF